MTEEEWRLSVKTGCVTSKYVFGGWIAWQGWVGHTWLGQTRIEALQKAALAMGLECEGISDEVPDMEGKQ